MRARWTSQEVDGASPAARGHRESMASPRRLSSRATAGN
jgi:hypothetical protein